MQNIGEEMCGEYLKHIKSCEFISYNITNPDVQGEIDVVGINLKKKTIYVCEVAIHTQGLQYTKNGKPNNYNKFLDKFKKDIEYAEKYFKNYKIIPMLWSPIVRNSNDSAKHNAYEDLQKVKLKIKNDYNLDLDLVINNRFLDIMEELKDHTNSKTSEFMSNVMRIFQIENCLKKYVKHLEKRK